jgi:hypothetical protein
VLGKIVALLGGLRPEDIDQASPVQRQQFAALARHWAQLAERRQDQQQPPASGILSDLKDGKRSE